MFLPETDWIRKWAEYTPGRMALREHERGLEWSYADFNLRAEALAKYLVDELKTGRGERIAVYSQNRAEYVLLFEACVKTGSILVPLNFRLTPPELDKLIGDAEPALFIYEKGFAGQLAEFKTLGGVPKKEMEDFAVFLTDQISGEPSFLPEQPSREEDVVMILYTAGTTGLSKGVMITHRMLFWNSVNTKLRLDLTSADHTQGCTPFFHTGGWNVLLTPFLHQGASTTLLNRFDPDLMLRLMEEERTTLFFGVPTMMQAMADSHEFENTDLSSVRYAVVGGAPMPEPLINRWHEKGVFIRQGYGLTEVGPNCFSLHQEDAIRKCGSIGFPNFYIDARIVDTEGNGCVVNEVGELWLRSPVVTSGYWRRKKETAEAIVEGWFRTGDLVKRDEEGFYYVVDRKKNMFISGGENVYPADVERFLYTHPAVREVAVTGVPDEKWGEVGRAFVAMKEGCSLTREELIDFCKGRIAKFKTPKHITFLDELPKNDAGKINRLTLKEIPLG